LYLTKDYSLDCAAARHRSYQIFAGFMVMLTAIGLPVLYFVILYRNRKKPLQELSFFTRDYKKKYKYW
jgi:hypothetical protein